MNTKMSWMKKGLAAIAIAVMIGLLAFAAPARVYAANGMEGTPPPTQPAANPARLEKVYQKLVDLLAKQEEHLGKIDTKIADVTERIAGLKAEGKDVTALEAALAGYQAKVDEAKAMHGEAAAILGTHAGFDAAGKVVDAAAAKETIKTAGEKMRDAHQELRPALRELMKALREFRRDNK
jgi:hypothetical protein